MDNPAPPPSLAPWPPNICPYMFHCIMCLCAASVDVTNRAAQNVAGRLLHSHCDLQTWHHQSYFFLPFTPLFFALLSLLPFCPLARPHLVIIAR